MNYPFHFYFLHQHLLKTAPRSIYPIELEYKYQSVFITGYSFKGVNLFSAMLAIHRILSLAGNSVSNELPFGTELFPVQDVC